MEPKKFSFSLILELKFSSWPIPSDQNVLLIKVLFSLFILSLPTTALIGPFPKDFP